MATTLLIDGNNLLHAMHAHAPIQHVGRETLVRIIDRWSAARGPDNPESGTTRSTNAGSARKRTASNGSREGETEQRGGGNTDALRVTVVFDGQVPVKGLHQQMMRAAVDVRFSGGITADEVIIAMVQESKSPMSIRVVSSDKSILYEARLHRCRTCESDAFVKELFGLRDADQSPVPSGTDDESEVEKPSGGSVDDWLEWLGADDLDLDDDLGEMMR